LAATVPPPHPTVQQLIAQKKASLRHLYNTAPHLDVYDIIMLAPNRRIETHPPKPIMTPSMTGLPTKISRVSIFVWDYLHGKEYTRKDYA
jgi:hypothetical protein